MMFPWKTSIHFGDLPASPVRSSHGRESLRLGNDHNLAESVTTDATTTFTVFLVPEYY